MSLDPSGNGPGARWRPDLLDGMTAWFADRPGVTSQPMFGVPAFFVEGRVFACVWGDGVGVRLSTETGQSVVGLRGLKSFTPFGRSPIRGWLQRDCTSDPDFAATQALCDAAYEYVQSL